MKLASYLALFASMASCLSAAQPATRQVLTLEIAKQVAAAASAEATANKWTVVIAILDEGGNLMYLERADDTQIGSIQVAQEKAKSAVSFKRPTKAFEEAVAGGRTAILKLPGSDAGGRRSSADVERSCRRRNRCEWSDVAAGRSNRQGRRRRASEDCRQVISNLIHGGRRSSNRISAIAIPASPCVHRRSVRSVGGVTSGLVMTALGYQSSHTLDFEATTTTPTTTAATPIPDGAAT